jgi:hypothetical protein
MGITFGMVVFTTLAIMIFVAIEMQSRRRSRIEAPVRIDRAA